MQYRVVAYALFAFLTGTLSTIAVTGSAAGAVPDGLTAQNRSQYD